MEKNGKSYYNTLIEYFKNKTEKKKNWAQEKNVHRKLAENCVKLKQKFQQ